MNKYHGMSDETWLQCKMQIREALIDVAKRGKTITYTNLVKGVDAAALRPDSPALHAMLGEISTEENEAGRGMLSVIVITKHGETQPGTGFFDLARRLGRHVHDPLVFWVEEFRKVQSYWQSQKPGDSQRA